MKLIDTHAHLYLEEFNEDRAETISRAKNAGIESIILPNINSKSISVLNQMTEKYPNYCYAAMGLHPTSVKADWESELAIILDEINLNRQKYIAIGEIGIDLYWDKTFFKEQTIVFSEQLKTASKQNLPAIIHVREAMDETLEILEELKNENFKGVFHSFSGNIEHARKIKQMGFFIGINGVVTYKNSNLSEIINANGIDNLVLETDSPYLTPVPHRGKRNESAYINIITRRISEISGLSLSQVAETTTANAEKLFNLQK